MNGAGQAVSALMRAIGPTIGGFSWSASISLHIPGQQYLVRMDLHPFKGQQPVPPACASDQCALLTWMSWLCAPLLKTILVMLHSF